MPRVSKKNQVTLPVAVMRAVGLAPGDEVVIRPGQNGEVVIEAPRARERAHRHAGIASGIYRAGELAQQRGDWSSAPPSDARQ